MPQLHLYVSQSVAEEIRRRAESKGLSVSAFLADLVKAEVNDDGWPVGYLQEVIGSFQEDPLERPAQSGLEERDSLF